MSNAQHPLQNNTPIHLAGLDEPEFWWATASHFFLAPLSNPPNNVGFPQSYSGYLPSSTAIHPDLFENNNTVQYYPSPHHGQDITLDQPVAAYGQDFLPKAPSQWAQADAEEPHAPSLADYYWDWILESLLAPTQQLLAPGSAYAFTDPNLMENPTPQQYDTVKYKEACVACARDDFAGLIPQCSRANEKE
ncbi:hypothetical protein CPB83DRAFT_833313 [Crepidotus variabilis]|uniref:Uncharacterized protein n=1 Tax=Crepidotus variabilis TaxID=179855 RepID=A0A9P6JTJ7_9AGAR|nr:hypothetical protein CPB83DRAFT_833313 [Crepidotus variabilis]